MRQQFEKEAETWGRFFNAVPTTEDGRRSSTPWGNGVREAMKEAVGVEGSCPDSEDSTIRLKFEDDSVLDIVNPAQHFCAGFVKVIS